MSVDQPPLCRDLVGLAEPPRSAFPFEPPALFRMRDDVHDVVDVIPDEEIEAPLCCRGPAKKNFTCLKTAFRTQGGRPCRVLPVRMQLAYDVAKTRERSREICVERYVPA